MSIDLRMAAADYLQTRRAWGYKLIDHERLIFAFLDKLAPGTTAITVEDAVDFATASSGSVRWHATRLAAIRPFASHVHGLEPAAAQLIPAGLIIARVTRRIPYLYSDDQIAELMARTGTVLRPPLAATMRTLIGLLAVTGLRSGEAFALDTDDMDPDQALLSVTGKYGKERLVPLHASTVEMLLAYQRSRTAGALTTSARPLLVGSTGNRLNPGFARALFQRVVKQCVLPTQPGCGSPRLHDFRHTFAVNSLVDAYRQGANVDARVAALVTYLGHANPVNTYWYLSASPELLTLASDRVVAYLQGSRS